MQTCTKVGLGLVVLAIIYYMTVVQDTKIQRHDLALLQQEIERIKAKVDSDAVGLQRREEKLNALENELIRARAIVESKGQATAKELARIKELERNLASEEVRVKAMEDKLNRDRERLETAQQQEKRALEEERDNLKRQIDYTMELNRKQQVALAECADQRGLVRQYGRAIIELGGCLTSDDCPSGKLCMGNNQCKAKPLTAKTTEGNNLKLTCPVGQTLRIVDASYGNKEQNCRSTANAFPVVSALCKQQNQCTVPANNTTFGSDPCKGIQKELEVSYECV